MDQKAYQEDILDSWVFDNFTLADKLFAKALRIFAICLLVTKKFFGKKWCTCRYSKCKFWFWR